VLRRQKKGAAYIPTDPYMFLELVASFKALVHVLFGSASPLYLDADKLYNIALDGQKYGHLRSIRLYQPDWFAHVLWQIYLYTRNFFDTSLRLDQLDHGARLPWPFQHFFYSIRMFGNYSSTVTPRQLLPLWGGNQNQDGKRKGLPDTEQGGKKPKTTGKPTHSHQVPQPLHQLRVAVQNHAPSTPISRVLRAGGSDISKLIQATGVPPKTCCRLLFWGACGGTNCTLAHDPVHLAPAAVEKAMAILQPGADKIMAHPPTSA